MNAKTKFFTNEQIAPSSADDCVNPPARKSSPIGLKVYALLLTIAVILIVIPEPITTSAGILLKIGLAYIGLRYAVLPLLGWLAVWLVKLGALVVALLTVWMVA